MGLPDEILENEKETLKEPSPLDRNKAPNYLTELKNFI